MLGGAFRSTGMLLARTELPRFPLFSSIGDTSRIDLNLLGGPEVVDCCCSGSGELGGEIGS